MTFEVGDIIRFNKKTKKSIKGFFLATQIRVEKVYKITAIEKFNEIMVIEVRDDEDNILHCPVDLKFKFFNKPTKYRLFRRANGNI